LFKRKSAARVLFAWLFAATSFNSFGAPPNRPTSNSPIPASSLEIRLQTHLTSYASHSGSRFQCIVIRSLQVDGEVLIPMGSIVSGHVVKAKSVGLGLWRDRASLTLAFDEYTTPNGRAFPLEAKLTSLDNANEQVTSKGVIKGIIAASNPNNFIFGVWGVPSMDQFSRSLIGLTGASNQLYAKFALGPIGAVGLLGLRCALFRFPEPEIHLPPGADMTLAVNISPADLANATGDSNTAANDRPSSELSDWLRNTPYNIEKRNGAPAGDVINVALIGSREEVAKAFQDAGWTAADPNTYRNYSHMYGAFNGMRVYSAAPVSTLLYEGVTPDMVFEKSLNSIAKRHHIRIWHTRMVDGQDIWLGAATHDSGIAFKFRSASFTHKIDSQIDVERTKIVTDLVFAGCSENAWRIDRPDYTSNRGSVIATDGAVEVLALHTCSNPAVFLDLPVPAPPGNKASRLTRRIVMEARNYIWRENAYYLGYEIVRYKLASRSNTASEQSFAAR
jgi:hypothetical protein